MRKLQDFQEQSGANALANYLETQGIEAQVRDHGDGHGVWVLLDEDVPRARELATAFQSGRPADLVELEKTADKHRHEREKDSRPVFTPNIRTQSFSKGMWGPGILGLVAISALVAFVTQLGHEPLPALYIAPVNLEERYFLPLDWAQPWRFITPIFMHFGVFHVLFNMMWLHELGGQIESREGTMTLLAVVVLGAAVSNLAQYYWSGPNFGGMSGVNYVLFAYVWMRARYAPNSGYSLPASTTWWLMGWLVLCGTGTMGPIANTAHAVGLIVGLGLGLPSYLRFRRVYRIKTSFEKGSWEDLNLKGFKRFERLVLQPYLPWWFLLVAVLVALT